ncbi:MAG: NAD(P)-dependent oxidoreductase [Candidatus Harrisonbacteria bacterium]|nr:NAD(P)-dependent oxidoreductase [Candidatus Harrisonbacteria bacterium]
MKRILITGAGGLLGKELSGHLKSQFEVIQLTHQDIEIADPESIHAQLETHRPDIVINCAAILNINFCEQNPAKCYAVNRDGIKNILEALIELKKPTIVVQISTSEVFGGTFQNCKVEGYKENDDRQPISAYQKAKKEAEDLIQEIASAHPETFLKWFIVRTGWLYGRGRQTFVDRFINDLKEKNELSVIQDQWRSPTWTHDFAEGLNNLLGGNYASGIFHLVNEVNAGEATTLDVLKLIANHLKIPMEKFRLTFVNQDKFFKVPRAPSNVLLNTKLPKLPHWRVSLQKYLEKYYSL